MKGFEGRIPSRYTTMENEVKHSNFIHDIIDVDLQNNPDLKIHTRFPPSPTATSTSVP